MELLNDSGLSSLSGFSYQIKVFILRLTQLQQGQRVEFETLDDVAVRSLSSKDSISDSCFKWKVDETSSIEVFQVKKRQHLQGSVYKGNNKVDLVLKFLSQACGLFDELCEQMPYIFQAIDLLVKDGFCETHEGELVCSLTSQQKAVDYDAFTEAAIQESKSYSDRQFLREVISIV